MRPSHLSLPLLLWAAVSCPGPGAPIGPGTAHEGGAGGAAVLAFLVPPGNAVAGRPLVPSVRVQAQDTLGNVLTTFNGTVTITLGENPSGATLSGNTSVRAAAGVAIFDTLAIDRPGRGYTLVASASGLADATSFSFDIFSP